MTDVWAGNAVRVLRALEVLAVKPRTPVELAAELGVKVSTARRILRRLEAVGYAAVSSGDPRRYGPTLRPVALAGAVLGTSPLVEASMPHITQLRDTLGETTCLCVPSMLAVLCVARAPGDAEEGSRPGLRGQRLPAHATAAGKALLAWRDEWRVEVLRQALPLCTERTKTGSELELDLYKARTKEFAVEVREYDEWTNAVAAPVFESGEAVAALVVVGDVKRFSDTDLVEVGSTVRDAALALVEDLGPPVRPDAEPA